MLTAEDLVATGAADLTELVNGVLVPMTPASYRHGRVAGRFVRALDEQAERAGGGEVVTAEAGFVIRRGPDTVRAPDAAFVSAARAAARDPESVFFEGAPDLAVEVLSPGDRTAEILAQVAEYLAAGARLVWVVDPEAGALTVFRPTGAPTVLGLDDVVDGEDVLPGFARPLRELLV
jgi:Uma2 family endonuclease